MMTCFEEMCKSMRDTLVFKRGNLYDSLISNGKNTFSPNIELIDELLYYTRRNSTRGFHDLIPSKEFDR